MKHCLLGLPRHTVRHLIAAAVLGLASLGGVGVPAASATAGPPVILSFANKTLEITSPIVARLCGAGAAVGSRSYLQEQEGTLHVWRAVGRPLTLAATECGSLRISTPEVGRLLFRVRYWANGKLIYISHEQGVTVYGPVGLVTFCNAAGGCNLAGGTTEILGHLDTYIDFACNGQPGAVGCGGFVTNDGSGLPGSFVFTSRNSCRSLQMTAFMTDVTGSETPGDQITIAVIQHTLNEQTANLAYNQISNETFELDGGPVQIQLTASTQFEAFYLLSSTLDCSTPTGQL